MRWPALLRRRPRCPTCRRRMRWVETWTLWTCTRCPVVLDNGAARPGVRPYTPEARRGDA